MPLLVEKGCGVVHGFAVMRDFSRAYIYKVFWDYEFVAGPFLCAKSS